MDLVQISLRKEDAAYVLHGAAFDAAKYGALCDYMASNVSDIPSDALMLGASLVEVKKEWTGRFLRAKRITEAFGVDYAPVTEDATVSPLSKPAPGMKPRRCYREREHLAACEAAATRVSTIGFKLALEEATFLFRLIHALRGHSSSARPCVGAPIFRGKRKAPAAGAAGADLRIVTRS